MGHAAEGIREAENRVIDYRGRAAKYVPGLPKVFSKPSPLLTRAALGVVCDAHAQSQLRIEKWIKIRY
jgi:hypothetical protein